VETHSKILKLVEEVRGLLDLPRGRKPLAEWKKQKYTKDEKAAHAAHKEQHKAADAERGGEHAKTMGGAFKKGTKHNPFKYLKKGKRLGPAVRGDDQHPGKQSGRWRCRCSAYKCRCRGIGEDNKGQKKLVHINRAYKGKYNLQYRKWRKRHAKKYEGGRWKKRPNRGQEKKTTD
jgi:hypothetical protein